MRELMLAAAHVRLHRNAIMVLKVGGACLRKARNRRALAAQIATIHALGGRPLLVHGGGEQTDQVQRQLGEEPLKVDGRRVTSETALRALRWSVAGELNGDLCAALSAAQAPAVGICAADAHIVRARRREPMATSAGMTDFGAVGSIETVDPAPLLALLDRGFLPVVCPPVADGQGGFLNLNADLLAAELAVSLGAAKLVLLTSASGILADPSDPESALSLLGLEQLDALQASGALHDGMLVKAAAMRRALKAGVPRVHVVSGHDPEALLVELYTSQGAGTLIQAEAALAAQPQQA